MNWLPHYIKRAGTNANRLAKAAGTTRQQISKLCKPHRDIGREWANKLAPLLSVTPQELQFGPDTIDVPSTHAPVIGGAAAGLWRETEAWDEEKYPPVPATPKVYPGLKQRAYRIEGPSMDRLRIYDGDFVLTVPYWEARSVFTDGDVVIVERRRGQLVETTCKQIALTATGAELWPRSHDQRFREPLVIPRDTGPPDGQGEAIEVVALVVGRFGYV